MTSLDAPDSRSSKRGNHLSVLDVMDFLEHANDLVQSVAPDGTFIYVNNAWKRTLGYSSDDIKNMKFHDIISEDCMGHCSLTFQKVLQGEKVEHLEVSFKAKDGRIIYAEGSCNCRFQDGKPVSTRGIFRDITEKKKLTEEQNKLKKRLEKSRLFESLGIMAGGIAHDYNNILMIILGFAELLQEKTKFLPEFHGHVETIYQSALKAEALTKQMLAFAGAGTIDIEVTDLSVFVGDVEADLLEILPGNIELVLELKSDLPAVQADSFQLMQAVMNLVSNASEAIGSNTGKIIISTGTVKVRDGFFRDAVLDDSLPPGEYCFVEVMDNGTGMSPDVREKAFEPFFSTKFQGRGLGLASTLGIVRGHRGAVKLVSSPGRGTRISMFFPAFSPPG